MGLFSTQPANDIEKARLALSFFHNKSVAFRPKYSETLDSLIAKVGGKNPTMFLEDFGFAINTLEMSVGQVQQAMEYLANKTQGSLPTKTAFFQSLSARLSNPTVMDYVRATPEIAGATALDAVHGMKQIGDAVIDTGKSLLVVGPLLIVAAVIFIGYARTRQYAGR